MSRKPKTEPATKPYQILSSWLEPSRLLTLLLGPTQLLAVGSDTPHRIARPLVALFTTIGEDSRTQNQRGIGNHLFLLCAALALY